MWSLLEDILSLIDVIWHWRFMLCLVLGLGLAAAALGRISAEPLRWIVAGAIVLISVVIGWRWDRAN